MTEHHDFRILGCLVAAQQEQPAKYPDHDQVEETRRHKSRSCPNSASGQTAGHDPCPVLKRYTRHRGLSGGAANSPDSPTRSGPAPTLAAQWAHQVAGEFPDGQLYVNLRGFDPGGVAMEPATAVRGFLQALGTPPDRMPADLDDQAALYRSLVAGKRVLVVLDNARDVDQVRPLLPGSPGCLVVVTSRNQLASLVAVEGARPVTLALLAAAEAREMLASRLGAARVAAEPAATEEIIARCARLPLALAIVAGRGAMHPAFSLDALAREMGAQADRLDAFDSDDAATDLRSVFSWSYRSLSPDAARLFRLLGLHPGPDFTAPAAASLAGQSLPEARRLLAALTGANLINEHQPGRYAFHDLLRTYAAAQVRAHDSNGERTAVLRRILEHYPYSAQVAARVLYVE